MPAIPTTTRPLAGRCALTASLLLHLGLLALATRSGADPARPAPARNLVLVWIELPPPARLPTAPPVPATAADRRAPPPRAASPRAAGVSPTSAPAQPPAEPGLSLQALVAQGAAAVAGPGPDFRRDRLRPPPPLAAPPPERIRMREPMTAAAVLAAVGQLLGGPGYEADPCPRVRRNLGPLMTAGADDPALREELHRLRTLCGAGG